MLPHSPMLAAASTGPTLTGLDWLAIVFYFSIPPCW